MGNEMTKAEMTALLMQSLKTAADLIDQLCPENAKVIPFVEAIAEGQPPAVAKLVPVGCFVSLLVTAIKNHKLNAQS